MIRYFALLGLQLVSGQFCGIQASCSSCTSLAGCVWNQNVCLSVSAVLSCISPGCIGYLGICPALTLYPPISSAPVFASTPIIPSLPPLPPLPPLLPSLPLYASASLYARPTVVPPIINPPLFAPPLYSTAPLVRTSVSAPVYSQLPETYTAPFLPAALPPITASVASPLYAGVGASASFAAPIYSSAYVPPMRGPYGGPFVNTNILPRPLFDTRGNPVDNIIHNNFIASGLNSIIPGIGGVVGMANDVNLITNTPRFVNNVVRGVGYNRDPLGNFVRNNFYADQLGRFIPGVSGSLSAFNKLNLYTSLLG
jgi:hypothetical protein